MATTNITDSHKQNFKAITSGEYDNFVLISCFLEGEPTCAIAAMAEDGEEIRITPMFVALTPGMVLTDHDRCEAGFNE